MNINGLELDYGETAPGNYLIGYMIKYYTDKQNPEFWKQRKKRQNTITPRSFAHFRLDLVFWRLEARYNFKTNRKSIKEVLFK